MTRFDVDMDTDPSELGAARCGELAGELRRELNRHNYLYYVKARPEIRLNTTLEAWTVGSGALCVGKSLSAE